MQPLPLSSCNKYNNNYYSVILLLYNYCTHMQLLIASVYGQVVLIIRMLYDEHRRLRRYKRKLVCEYADNNRG